VDIITEDIESSNFACFQHYVFSKSSRQIVFTHPCVVSLCTHRDTTRLSLSCIIIDDRYIPCATVLGLLMLANRIGKICKG
jgi:hypothetical protein